MGQVAQAAGGETWEAKEWPPRGPANTAQRPVGVEGHCGPGLGQVWVVGF